MKMIRRVFFGLFLSTMLGACGGTESDKLSTSTQALTYEDCNQISSLCMGDCSATYPDGPYDSTCGCQLRNRKGAECRAGCIDDKYNNCYPAVENQTSVGYIIH